MMKPLLAFGIVCLFISCEAKNYSVLVTNNSKEKTVSYTYNGSSDILAPGESKTYEVEAYTRPPENIKDENGIASIEIERDGDNFVFKDATQMEMNILNTLPVNVERIKADNYISYNGSFLVSVPPGGTILKELYIYTDKPNFSLEADSNGIIEPSYPVRFEWSITDLPETDDSGNPKKKLSLVIR